MARKSHLFNVAVLGIGLMAAAFNPSANVAWVRAGILYGLVVLAFEGGSYLLWREPFHIGPVFFGLAFSLLLIALYPQRRDLVPHETPAATKAAEPAPKAGPPPKAAHTRRSRETPSPSSGWVTT